MQKLHAISLGVAGAIVSAACMFVLGTIANLGMYTGAAQMMRGWHMFFSLSLLGILGGMIEAAVIGFIVLWLLAVVYNAMTENLK